MANSNAMQGVAPGGTVYYDMSPWKIGAIVGECCLGALGLASIIWMIVRSIRVKKEKEAA